MFAITDNPLHGHTKRLFHPAGLRLPDEVGFLFRSEQRGFAVVWRIGVPDDFGKERRP